MTDVQPDSGAAFDVGAFRRLTLTPDTPNRKLLAAACDEIDRLRSHVRALEARVERSLNWREYDDALIARTEVAEAHVRALEDVVEAAREISYSGVRETDPRIEWIEAQVDREEWARFRAALARLDGEERDA